MIASRPFPPGRADPCSASPSSASRSPIPPSRRCSGPPSRRAVCRSPSSAGSAGRISCPDAIEALRGDEFAGALIAAPHKERTASLVDLLSDDAKVSGAANVVVRDGAPPARPQHRCRRRAGRPGGNPPQGARQVAPPGRGAGSRRRGSSGGRGPHRLWIPTDRRLQPAPAQGRGRGGPLRARRQGVGAARAAVARDLPGGRAGAGQAARQRQRDRRGGRNQRAAGRDARLRSRSCSTSC